jgi:hypothetical protein
MPKINFIGFKINVPANPILRIGFGILCIIGGIFSFLPVLGLWMLPLGLIILSIDFPPIRRWRRSTTVRLGYWLQRRWPGLARRLGFGQPRHGKHSGDL